MASPLTTSFTLSNLPDCFIGARAAQANIKLGQNASKALLISAVVFAVIVAIVAGVVWRNPSAFTHSLVAIKASMMAFGIGAIASGSIGILALVLSTRSLQKSRQFLTYNQLESICKQERTAAVAAGNVARQDSILTFQRKYNIELGVKDSIS